MTDYLNRIVLPSARVVAGNAAPAAKLATVLLESRRQPA
jgi:hypothetical protein